MPKISIIMPMLNSAEYLKECMDSVISQTLKDIEIIPVDAGSTDGTVEILEEYAKNDSRIKIIHSDKKSVGYQYNLGIAAAQGDYIGFVESDDYILPNMYERLLKPAEQNNLDWIKAGYAYFMDYPNIGRRMIPIKERRFCKSEEVFSPASNPEQYTQEIFMWRGIYNLEFVKRNNIVLNETKGAAFQDTGFILQVFMHAEKACYLNDPLYCYRRDNQGSSSHQANTIKFEIDEVEYITEIIKKNPKLYSLFWSVNYMRSFGRFMSAYNRVAPVNEKSIEIRDAAERYRSYLLCELAEQERFWEICNVAKWARELIWLREGIEKFDEEYQKLENMKEALLKAGIRKVLNYKKVIVFGCGDHGSGMISLLLRLGRNKIVSISDNDQNKWGKNFMGINVVPPKKLKTDLETIVLVANEEHFYEIKAQLIIQGIPECQIWLCPHIMGFRGTNLLPPDEILPLK